MLGHFMLFVPWVVVPKDSYIRMVILAAECILLHYLFSLLMDMAIVFKDQWRKFVMIYCYWSPPVVSLIYLDSWVYFAAYPVLSFSRFLLPMLLFFLDKAWSVLFVL